MAGRSEDLTYRELTCAMCKTTFVGMTRATELAHLENGTHRLSVPRPDHRTVSIWSDVRAALEHIRTAEFYLGYLPEKPQAYDDEAVRMQLDDARAVLGALANALADGSAS